MEIQPISPSDIEKNKELAALSYLWIFSFIILLARRDSPFVQLHARQGLILFILSIFLWPFSFTRYFELFILALMIFGFIQAAMGKVYSIPVIGNIAMGHFSRKSLKADWERLGSPEENIPAESAVSSGQPSLEKPQTASLIGELQKDEKKIHELEEELKTLKSTLASKPS